jgi:hypothetical protein
MVFNLYFSLCGWPYFQLLRELFLLIFGFKNSKRYQISGTHFASKSTSDDRHDGDSKGVIHSPR